MKYKFPCGCEYSIDDPDIRPPKTNRLECPIHHSNKPTYITICLLCGKVISGRTSTKKFCTACIKKRHREKEKESYSTLNLMPKTKTVIPKRKHDCEHYLTCLSGILQKNDKACMGCKKYKKRDSSLDIFVHEKCNDSFTPLTIRKS